MCAPIIIGIATAVMGAVGTIAGYQQQQAQVTAANNAAWQQTVLQNKQIANQSQQALRQNIFALQQHNMAVEFQNQNILQQSLMQVDAVNQGNLRANQDWQNALVANDYQNLNQQLEFTQQLSRSRLSKQISDLQQQMNQRGLSSELEEAQRRLREAQAVAAFEGERLLVSNLTASGTLLASGKSGSSIGLAQQNIDAAYGRDMSMVGTNYENKREGFFSDVTNAFVKKSQADWDAVSKIIPEPTNPIGIPAPPEPIYASQPRDPIFAPMQTELAPWSKPIFAPAPAKASGPGGIGLVAGIGTSILGGVSAGLSSAGAIKALK